MNIISQRLIDDSGFQKSKKEYNWLTFFFNVFLLSMKRNLDMGLNKSALIITVARRTDWGPMLSFIFVWNTWFVNYIMQGSNLRLLQNIKHNHSIVHFYSHRMFKFDISSMCTCFSIVHDDILKLLTIKVTLMLNILVEFIILLFKSKIHCFQVIMVLSDLVLSPSCFSQSV